MKYTLFLFVTVLFLPVTLAGFLYELVVQWFDVGQLVAKDTSEWLVK